MNVEFEKWKPQKGDIIVYESMDSKYIIIFESWYEPYEGCMHYYALYDCDTHELYINGTCFIIDEDYLKPETDEDHMVLLNELNFKGYAWDGKNLNKL